MTAQVLVVDDDALVLRALARSLRRWGYTVLPAESVRAALALLEDGPVDLILTDLQMPHLSGFDLARALRRAGSSVPVLLISGSDPLEYQLQANELGIFVILQKPVEAAALAGALADALAGATPGSST